MTDQLYRQVISITEEYLGPAAERFLARQILAHLDKDPSELVAEDLPKLIEWSRVTLSLLTDDRKLIEDYVTKMTRLINSAPLPSE